MIGNFQDGFAESDGSADGNDVNPSGPCAPREDKIGHGPHTVERPISTQIPAISIGELLGDRPSEIKMTVLRYEDGMVPSEQAMKLLAVLVAARSI